MSKKQAVFLLLVLLNTRINAEGILDYFSTENVNSFLYNQLNNVYQAMDSSYKGAIILKEKISSYVYYNTSDNAKEVEVVERRNFTDGDFFILPEDPESRMENPDFVLSVPALVSRNGYSIETHTIASQGYILNIHRIPRPKTSSFISEKTVILQHGLFTSSFDWIRNGPQKSLAYVLADAGYDVWMPNIRGNKYSNEHAWYKRNTKEYWNFSWHEVALFDLPAIIDYILKIKGDTRIAYIGHSMGTTILFTMLSLRPEYNHKLSVGLALAPEVFLSNMKSPLKSVAGVMSYVAHAEMVYKSYEFVPKNAFFEGLVNMCESQQIDCQNIVFYLNGEDKEQLNRTRLNPFLSNLGSGTPWKTVVHMSQMILSGKFQQFDYGSDRNLRMYGTDTPPEYDLSKVSLNITLFWAQNDLLSNEMDVRKLHERLPDTTQMYLVPHPKFNHIDYLRAIEAPRLINSKVLQVLEGTYN